MGRLEVGLSRVRRLFQISEAFMSETERQAKMFLDADGLPQQLQLQLQECQDASGALASYQQDFVELGFDGLRLEPVSAGSEAKEEEALNEQAGITVADPRACLGISLVRHLFRMVD